MSFTATTGGEAVSLADLSDALRGNVAPPELDDGANALLNAGVFVAQTLAAAKSFSHGGVSVTISGHAPTDETSRTPTLVVSVTGAEVPLPEPPPEPAAELEPVEPF